MKLRERWKKSYEKMKIIAFAFHEVSWNYKNNTCYTVELFPTHVRATFLDVEAFNLTYVQYI